MITTIKKNPGKSATAGAAIAIAVLIPNSEGIRTKAYPDPATKGPPWTVCFGETKNIGRNDTFTMAECKAMLQTRVMNDFVPGIDKCLTVELPPHRWAAVISFAYNVGVGAFCKSTFAKRLNAGEGAAACSELFKWTTAAGIRLPGLVKRRKEENAYCIRED